MRTKKKLAIGFVAIAAGGIGLGFYLGWFDLRTVQQTATDRNTWIDLKTKAQQKEAQLKAKVNQLTAPEPVATTQAVSVCRQNLRRLESAKRAVATRKGLSTGTVSWDDVLKEMGGKRPVCPSGGEYTLGSLEYLPRCSIGAGGTPDTKDDHAIASY